MRSGRLILVLACLLQSAGSAGVELDVLDVPAPSQLNFSAAEVDAHAEATWQTMLNREAAAGRLGCRRHCSRIAEIFARLQRAVALIVDSPPIPWQLAIGINPGDEAWALAGGRVYISESFIDAEHLDDEQLAFVLAHEMGHALLQHENQALSFAAAMAPRAVRGSVERLYEELDANLPLSLKLQPEWQAEELEADRAAMLIGGTAGYSADGLLRFLQREAMRSQHSQGVFGSHPDARLRYERAKTYRSSAMVLKRRFASSFAAGRRLPAPAP